MSEKTPIIVVIDGHQYDISGFEHPGDGRTLQIKKYDGKDVTKKFIIAHHDSGPSEMLETARKTGECEGIKYIGVVKET